MLSGTLNIDLYSNPFNWLCNISSKFFARLDSFFYLSSSCKIMIFTICFHYIEDPKINVFEQSNLCTKFVFYNLQVIGTSWSILRMLLMLKGLSIIMRTLLFAQGLGGNLVLCIFLLITETNKYYLYKRVPSVKRISLVRKTWVLLFIYFIVLLLVYAIS